MILVLLESMNLDLVDIETLHIFIHKNNKLKKICTQK
jgi:hypothetical protein